MYLLHFITVFVYLGRYYSVFFFLLFVWKAGYERLMSSVVPARPLVTHSETRLVLVSKETVSMETACILKLLWLSKSGSYWLILFL